MPNPIYGDECRCVRMASGMLIHGFESELQGSEPMGKQKRVARLRLGRPEKIKLALGSVVLIGVLISFMRLAISNAGPGKEESRIPAFFETIQQAGALPATLSPELFAKSAAAKAYRVAQEIPGVLAQQPCFCHCDRTSGHRSLVDCYRDNHAAGCLICIKEALLARKLHQEGVTDAGIRQRIIAGDWQKIEVAGN